MTYVGITFYPMKGQWAGLVPPLRGGETIEERTGGVVVDITGVKGTGWEIRLVKQRQF